MNQNRRHLCISGPLAALALLVACNQDAIVPVKPNNSVHSLGPPVSLKITGTLTAQVGQSVSLSTESKDSAGQILFPESVAWSSSDSTLIAVAANGTVTPLRIGTVTLTAVAGSLRDSSVFTSSLAPYTFVFADSISPAERQLIRDGVQYAHAFHQATFGRAIQESTTVSGVLSAPGCSNGGAAAFTGPRAVTFCLGNPGWMANGPILKQKIVQHELFHVWQFEYGWLGNPSTAGATWVIEGSAELMGFKGIAAKNELAFPTAIGCQVKQASDFTARMPPGLPSLMTVETQQAFQNTVGPLYTTSMLAMDYLTAANGLNALRAYGDAVAAGTDWHAAFAAAFGMSTDIFYAQFPAYLAGLPVPPNYLCGI